VVGRRVQRATPPVRALHEERQGSVDDATGASGSVGVETNPSEADASTLDRARARAEASSELPTGVQRRETVFPSLTSMTFTRSVAIGSSMVRKGGTALVRRAGGDLHAHYPRNWSFSLTLAVELLGRGLHSSST